MVTPGRAATKSCLPGFHTHSRPAEPGQAQQTLPFASSHNTTLIPHREASPPSQTPPFVLVPWIWQAPQSASRHGTPERKRSHLEAVPAPGIVNFATSSPPRMVPGWGHSTSVSLAHPARPRAGSSPRPSLLTSSSCTLRGISNMHICTGCTRAFCTLNKGFASIFPGVEGLLILLSLCLLRRSSPRSRSSPGGETNRSEISLRVQFCQRILPTAAAPAAPTRSCFLPRESKSREELHREAERARV